MQLKVSYFIFSSVALSWFFSKTLLSNWVNTWPVYDLIQASWYSSSEACLCFEYADTHLRWGMSLFWEYRVAVTYWKILSPDQIQLDGEYVRYRQTLQKIRQEFRFIWSCIAGYLTQYTSGVITGRKGYLFCCLSFPIKCHILLEMG